MPESPDFQEFLNHLTDNALMSLKTADQIARAQNSAYVGTEHILLGLTCFRRPYFHLHRCKRQIAY